MDQRHRAFLQTNHQKLAAAIKRHVSDIGDYLCSTRIISEDMKDRVVLITKTPKQQASDLLYLLPTRGPDAYQALYDAVMEAEAYDAADILRPGSAPHAPSYQQQSGKLATSQAGNIVGDFSDDEELPDVWPLSQEELSAVKTVKTHNDPSVHSPERYVNFYYHKVCSPSGFRKYYQMTHAARGPCLIFSNEKFDEMDDRIGNKQDEEGLEDLFLNLGFDPEVFRNKKSQDMEKTLEKKIEGLRGRENIDCFVLVIMSHGEDGVIFGTNGYTDEAGIPRNCIKVEKIRDRVCSVEALMYKPKLFFFQACRGSKQDPGRSSAQPQGKIKMDSTDSAASGINNGMNISQEKGQGDDHSLGAGSKADDSSPSDIDISQSREVIKKFTFPETADDSSGSRLPSLADVFCAMSTTKEHKSYRNTFSGTWFIQAIIYVFSRFAYKHDLLTLMTMVNKLVAQSEVEKGKYKQICEFTPYLLKKFHFFPELSNEGK